MPTMTTEPRFRTIPQVAALVGKSEADIRRAILAGVVPAYKFGRPILIASRDLPKLVEDQP